MSKIYLGDTDRKSWSPGLTVHLGPQLEWNSGNEWITGIESDSEGDVKKQTQHSQWSQLRHDEFYS